MSVNFYNEFARFLKSSRERSGKSIAEIAQVTRINSVYIELMENGVFDFASSVLIQGYLRKYAQVIGLKPDALSKQYNLILRKIDYVSSDQHLPPVFIEYQPAPAVKSYWPTVSIWKKEWWEHYARIFSAKPSPYTAPLSSPDAPKDDTQTIRLKSTSLTLDEEVQKKWLAERRMTNLVTLSAVMLIAISAVFYLTNPGSTGTWRSDEENLIPDAKNTTDVPAGKNPSGVKKVRLDMSAPLYSNPDRVSASAVLDWLARDSAAAVQNKKNQILKKNDPLVPITVHDIAKNSKE